MVMSQEMGWFDDAHREFTARYLGDLSKAIFAVALASKLFVELPTWLRVMLMISGVAFFLAAYVILPRKKGGQP